MCIIMNYSNKSNWSVIESYFKEGHLHQLVKHQIDSYNDFIQTQIFKTIEMFNPLIVHSPHDYFPKLNKYRLEVEITFQNLCIYRPEIHENNGSTKLMFPNKARLRNCTYTSHFTLDLNIKYIIRTGETLENEETRNSTYSAAFAITRNVISNAAYAIFVRESGYPPPGVDAATWAGYGFIHPFGRTRKFSWQGKTPPPGREHHPVVLVSHADARTYARWLSNKTGQLWRLPGEAEWEKAARGTDGRRFPWGDDFDPARLNSHDQGPFDTVPVGNFDNGASPYGMLDAGGQVFEWTSEAVGNGRFMVKGGSWDDKGCGICRPAARHSRPASIKHILIGFRLVTLLPPADNQGSY